jgi:hypothetical protein
MIFSISAIACLIAHDLSGIDWLLAVGLVLSVLGIIKCVNKL